MDFLKWIDGKFTSGSATRGRSLFHSSDWHLWCAMHSEHRTDVSRFLTNDIRITALRSYLQHLKLFVIAHYVQIILKQLQAPLCWEDSIIMWTFSQHPAYYAPARWGFQVPCSRAPHPWMRTYESAAQLLPPSPFFSYWSGFEPATLRLPVQHLNQYATDTRQAIVHITLGHVGKLNWLDIWSIYSVHSVLGKLHGKCSELSYQSLR